MSISKISSNTYIGVGVVVLIVSAVVFVMSNLGNHDKRITVLETNIQQQKDTTTMLRADVSRLEDNQALIKEDLAVIKNDLYRVLQAVSN